VRKDEAIEVRNILSNYEKCSGQTINKDKSEILFSASVTSDVKGSFLHHIGITSEVYNEKYFGLPVFIGKSKAKAFAFLKQKIWSRIQGWKEKLLSKAGKEILIKAIAQAIPVYAMSCFYLTKSVCDELTTMVLRYWWAQQEKDRKIHWLGKEKMMKPKSKGGLGFRDLHAFNIAMLARQGWRLIQHPRSLCAQILKARYYPDSNVLHAHSRSGMSYSWRSILKGIELLKKGIIWRVGDGEQIDVWDDPWLPRKSNRFIKSRRGPILIRKVCELIDPITNRWDASLIQSMFCQEDANVILKIPLREDEEDFIAWHPDTKGRFSVRSAYNLYIYEVEKEEGMQGQSGEDITCFNWKRIWKYQVPNKMKHFIWRLAHNSLPLRQNIKRRGVKLDTICPMCHRLDEDGGHLFLKCKCVRQLWRALDLEEARLLLVNCTSAKHLSEEIWKLDDEQQIEILTLLWVCRIKNTD